MVFGGLGSLQYPIAAIMTVVLLVGVRRVVDPTVFGLRGAASDRPVDVAGNAPDLGFSSSTPRTAIAEPQHSGTPQRVAQKRERYPRAIEIQNPTGFVNTDSITIGEYIGKRVILIEFWTFGCYNCQNTHPKIQRFWRKYRDDGLLVIGVHYPEFEREHKPSNVKKYVSETDTTYPIVLDNDGGTWNAYDQRYWPARYLIDVDGFIRYTHAGEGAYEETEQAIQQLLTERKQVLDE